jgi:hypothetical protein
MAAAAHCWHTQDRGKRDGTELRGRHTACQCSDLQPPAGSWAGLTVGRRVAQSTQEPRSNRQRPAMSSQFRRTGVAHPSTHRVAPVHLHPRSHPRHHRGSSLLHLTLLICHAQPHVRPCALGSTQTLLTSVPVAVPPAPPASPIRHVSALATPASRTPRTSIRSETRANGTGSCHVAGGHGPCWPRPPP